MKPVLIQHLMKKNKGKVKATATKEEVERFSSSFASVVFWCVAALVLVGLFLK